MSANIYNPNNPNKPNQTKHKYKNKQQTTNNKQQQIN